LSLQELRAKSREHWSYGGGVTARFGIERAFWSRVLEAPSHQIRLSRIDNYLTDNVSCTRLSDLKLAVNEEKLWPLNSSSPPLQKNVKVGQPPFFAAERRDWGQKAAPQGLKARIYFLHFWHE